MARRLWALWGVSLIMVSTLAGAQSAPEEAAQEPAAAGLARDLIGAPLGERLAGPELDRLTEEVTRLMRCPVCQGLSVADSPTTSALAMREEARDLLASGYTEDQVLAYFERSYGEFIRLSPKPEGFNLVVWILPFGALLAGALVIAGRMRRRARLAPEAAGERPTARKPGGEIPAELASYAERVRREVNE
ncbi:MAG: cytochrome c-type biogenesis protein CcmH [bacterium]|nr:cytochrome c-type biogenesis protein CcmH [bacterium]